MKIMGHITSPRVKIQDCLTQVGEGKEIAEAQGEKATMPRDKKSKVSRAGFQWVRAKDIWVWTEPKTERQRPPGGELGE